MISSHAVRPLTPRVTAIFNDGIQSFSLPRGATLGELALQIDGLGNQHDDAPVAIHITFGSAQMRPMSTKRFDKCIAASNSN